MNLLALVAKLDRLLRGLDSEVKTYPTTAAGVVVTAGAATYAKGGTWVEVIPASTVTTDFKPVAIVAEIISTIDEYELEIASGLAAAEVVISTHKFANIANLGTARVQIASIATQPANTRLSLRLSSKDGSNTASVSLEYVDALNS
tara:strand:+ start:6953 stop:7390 length:438 start_codon:yes stop_codon:yes gene_type:complete